MRNLSRRISKHASRVSEGTPVSAKQLLHLGSRAAVDQALSRLARRGKLMRVSRGIYVRPVRSRFGLRAPSPEKVVRKIAASRGETIARHGAAAANALGLTTQVPTRMVYLTSGPSRHLKLGAEVVELKHAPSWQFALPEHTGDVVRSLAWLGPDQASTTLAELSPSERKGLGANRQRLPGWLASAVSETL